MADPAYVKRLAQSVVGWNAWRQKHPGAKLDLSDADLSGANLSRANLSCTNLSRADLELADLNGTDLNGADLGGADLNDARMWDTVIADVDLRETKGLTEIQHLEPSHMELYSV